MSNILALAVAPRAGAWIEINTNIGRSKNSKQSLPVRERGLKSPLAAGCDNCRWSLPVRDNELKQIINITMLMAGQYYEL